MTETSHHDATTDLFPLDRRFSPEPSGSTQTHKNSHERQNHASNWKSPYVEAENDSDSNEMQSPGPDTAQVSRKGVGGHEAHWPRDGFNGAQPNAIHIEKQDDSSTNKPCGEFPMCTGRSELEPTFHINPQINVESSSVHEFPAHLVSSSAAAKPTSDEAYFPHPFDVMDISLDSPLPAKSVHQAGALVDSSDGTWRAAQIPYVQTPLNGGHVADSVDRVLDPVPPVSHSGIRTPPSLRTSHKTSTSDMNYRMHFSQESCLQEATTGATWTEAQTSDVSDVETPSLGEHGPSVTSDATNPNPSKVLTPGGIEEGHCNSYKASASARGFKRNISKFSGPNKARAIEEKQLTRRLTRKWRRWLGAPHRIRTRERNHRGTDGPRSMKCSNELLMNAMKDCFHMSQSTHGPDSRGMNPAEIREVSSPSWQGHTMQYPVTMDRGGSMERSFCSQAEAPSQLYQPTFSFYGSGNQSPPSSRVHGFQLPSALPHNHETDDTDADTQIDKMNKRQMSSTESKTKEDPIAVSPIGPGLEQPQTQPNADVVDQRQDTAVANHILDSKDTHTARLQRYDAISGRARPQRYKLGPKGEKNFQATNVAYASWVVLNGTYIKTVEHRAKSEVKNHVERHISRATNKSGQFYNINLRPVELEYGKPGYISLEDFIKDDDILLYQETSHAEVKNTSAFIETIAQRVTTSLRRYLSRENSAAREKAERKEVKARQARLRKEKLTTEKEGAVKRLRKSSQVKGDTKKSRNRKGRKNEKQVSDRKLRTALERSGLAQF
ncbi:hypothetical protein N7539_008815 [Penicillium diatomitis]|uniref:Uncharacterized protein n=1 Tax=Penicillium diatomitis TaxID=2819901 RepID=A0A9W9WRD6_9EURO|nr:uncharacterized protein N7539_008815 [Penicillium diatomitis]KAJ5471872.1 hypothetical protein N7539_008815 [Penicillium diatomitis]